MNKIDGMTTKEEVTKTTAEPNPSKPKQEKVYHFLMIGAATIIILAGIKAASSLVSPMLLALFATIILVVPLRWLRRHGCPNAIALIVVLGGTVLAFSAVSYFVGRSLNDFIVRVPAYKNRIVQKLDQLDKQLKQYGFVLGELGTDKNNKENQPPVDSLLPENPQAKQPLSPEQQPEKSTEEQSKTEMVEKKGEKKGLPTSVEHSTEHSTEYSEVAPDIDFGTLPGEVSGIETETEDEEGNKKQEVEVNGGLDDVPVSTDEEIAKILDNKTETSPTLTALRPESVMYWVTKTLVELRHVVESGFLVLIFTIFMIFEAARFPEKIDRAFGKDGPINNKHFHRIADDIRRYLFLKAIANIMSASAAMFVYWIFGVPATFFWGVMAYFLYFIPNIGGTLAAILPGMLIFMTYDVQGVLLYALCLVAIECSIAYGIEPKMLGYGLRLSTVVIILSLFSWGWLLGPVGLFLAAPLTIVVKIIFQAFKETEWLAILLDDNRCLRRDPTSADAGFTSGIIIEESSSRIIPR